MAKTSSQTMMLAAIVVAALVGMFWIATDGTFKMQASPTTAPSGTPASQTSTAGTNSFAPTSVDIDLKDASNPTTAISDTGVTAVAYAASTADSAVSSPNTAYLDSDANDASGNIVLAGKKMYTGTSYKIKFYDNAASPTYYPELKTVTVPSLNPALGSSVVATLDDVALTAIGTIADPMQSAATGAAGGSLQTGVTSVDGSNYVLINQSLAVPATITVRIPLTFADTAVNTKLRNMVLRPMQDGSSVIPTTAFTAATLIHNTGTGVNVAQADILSYVQNQQPIALGDWSDSTSDSYFLQVSLANTSITGTNTATNQFVFYFDDNGNYRQTDTIAGQAGSSFQNVTIKVALGA